MATTAILVGAVAVLSACGGAGGDTAALESDRGGCERLAAESAREDCEREEARAHVPAADRAAYYQLATTIGLLRAASVAAARGDPRPPTAGLRELDSARRRIELTRPRDRTLKRLRRDLSLMLKSAASDLDRDQARHFLRLIRFLEGGLTEYLHREPANASLLPD